MRKLFFGVLLVIISNISYAKICTNKLQEEANVFELNCLLDAKLCMVTGYFTHPKYVDGYSGLVAILQPTPDKLKRSGSQLTISTFRHGEAKVETPTGYFVALAKAERMLMNERKPRLIYFDAYTGKETQSPELLCE
ncbi:hypothetical protein [Shewanella gelidii]|uniref:Uncharacterized protein n=1 Tax=Shewanella gelidii TaxID=1642821 RepID=A0A917NBV4_9GAMM|nr:hypothetical protein [Shewanella gelidii]MCL1098030.1 hypothetical protein [Shewanella gelidii]GGI85555.1 hypothetical protein GCM10009332_23620 [Shewanella gelidii]